MSKGVEQKMKAFLILFLFFLSFQAFSYPYNFSPGFTPYNQNLTPFNLQPSLNINPLFLPQGTSLSPVCQYPQQSSFCLAQAGRISQLLSTNGTNSHWLPMYQTARLSDLSLYDLENNDDYEEVDLETPSVSTRKTRRNRRSGTRIFQKKEDKGTGKILIVDSSIGVDPKEVQVKEVNVNYLEEDSFESDGNGGYQVVEGGTYALLPEVRGTPQEKCIEINQSVETEGMAACPSGNCPKQPSGGGFRFLKNLSQNMIKMISLAERETDKMTQHKMGVKIYGGDILKICNPNLSLIAIRDNMADHCGVGNSDIKDLSQDTEFKNFFKDVACGSCAKGIPMEVMPAIMSIESAGDCKARNKNSREDSRGLWQVNQDGHNCSDLGCAQDILLDYLEKTNPSEVVNSIKNTSGCLSWADTPQEHKEAWMRATAAYNSGYGWVLRGLAAASEWDTIKDYPSYLNKTHLTNKGLDYLSQFKEHPASWEDLSEFFWLEKFNEMGSYEDGVKSKETCQDELRYGADDTGGTGRLVCLTMSNVAYTKAILGTQSQNGMVDSWTIYRKELGTMQCGGGIEL